MSPREIDVAAAEAALDAAGINPLETKPPGLPGGWTDGPESTPAAEATPVTPEPATEPAPEAPAADEDKPLAFSEITREAILAGDVTAEQLAAMHAGMNANFTQKSQELAPLRKLAKEYEMDADQIRESIETFQRLQDPGNWPTLHAELSQYLQQHGMAPAAANASASEQLANMVPETPDPLAELDLGDEDDQDPSVVALVNAHRAQAAQIEELKKLVTGDQEQRQQQAQYDALARSLTDAENNLRASNPHYTEDDIAFIYRLMPGDGSDPGQQLVSAAQAFDSEIAARVSRYIAGKGAAIEGGPTPLAGGGVIPAKAPEKLTPAEGHARAMAHARMLDEQDAQ